MIKNVLLIKKTGNFLWSKLQKKIFFSSLYSLYKKVSGAYLAGKPYPSVLRNPFPSFSLFQNETQIPVVKLAHQAQQTKVLKWCCDYGVELL